jgi:hypothetical protein
VNALGHRGRVSDTKDEKPLGLHEEVMGLWRRILGAGAFQVLAFGLLCGLAVLYATKALADETHHQVDAGLAPLSTRLDTHEREEAAHQELQDRELQAVTRRIESVERVSLETALNVRLLVEAAHLNPITLRGTDGGAP